MEKLKIYGANNFRRISQLTGRLSGEELTAIEVVSQVLPFRTNNFVVNDLINWDNLPDDPMFRLTFPHADMLLPAHFQEMKQVMERGGSREDIKTVANHIRALLNPNPAGQMQANTPILDGERITGLQHKYRETVLFFPSHGQTCHAYCTYCFRWPQFIGIDELKFSLQDVNVLVSYLKLHKNITDVVFTGGDPLIMATPLLEHYILPLLNDPELEHLNAIRIGTKCLSYWPYRFLTDNDADDLLRLFEKVVRAGKGLAIMAHFNHIVEMQSPVVQEAIRRVLSTGAQIRTQSPVMAHINDDEEVWRSMWVEQVRQGCIPYYMFMARDTGAQQYFAVPVVKALNIFQAAYKGVGGLSKTVRGPVMSADMGKVHILGVKEIHGEKVILFRFLQARDADLTEDIFFARYDEQAIWINDMQPAFGEEHFGFEKLVKIK